MHFSETTLATDIAASTANTANTEAVKAPSGLGDHTENLLKSIGITEDKYVEIKAKFGLAPTCGCGARKTWLNKVGAHFGIGA